MKNATIKAIYSDLLNRYGCQGWWPLLDYEGNNPTKTGSITGYHPGVFDVPSSRNQIYEVAIGAILTQSVGWVSVEKALKNLKGIGALTPEGLLKTDEKRLKDAIKPAGYFNDKTRKIRLFTQFFLPLKRVPLRDDLLKLWGIGPETADSILLYGYGVPTFVIDAYTRRIFTNLGYINEKDSYDDVKGLFEKNLTPDKVVFQEYHALIVEHAKRYYSRGMDVKLCPLYKKYAKAGVKRKN